MPFPLAGNGLRWPPPTAVARGASGLSLILWGGLAALKVKRLKLARTRKRIPNGRGAPRASRHTRANEQTRALNKRPTTPMCDDQTSTIRDQASGGNIAHACYVRALRAIYHTVQTSTIAANVTTSQSTHVSKALRLDRVASITSHIPCRCGYV
eukprot:4173126-Prymnesium_polylepis.1